MSTLSKRLIHNAIVQLIFQVGLKMVFPELSLMQYVFIISCVAYIGVCFVFSIPQKR
jgi:hypothetical protein